MEFTIPWQNWDNQDIQFGLTQINTRIEDGFFIPIYFSNNNVRCQAFHLLSPVLEIHNFSANSNGSFIILKIQNVSEFKEKLCDFEKRIIKHTYKNHAHFWNKDTLSKVTHKSTLTKLNDEFSGLKVQIPDSGLFSCFDTKRKHWYASNETGIQNRKMKILLRTSGIWIDQNSFGVEWKLIGSFVV